MKLYKARNNIFYILIFTLTFEYWDPFNLGRTFSITKMASILYIVSWVPFLRKELRLNNLKVYLIPLFLYLLTEVVSATLNSRYVGSIWDIFNFKVLQLTILMVLVSSHIIKNKSLINSTLKIYVVSVFVLSCLYFFGIGLGVGVIEERGRLTIFGENPNMIGMKAVIAILILLSFLLKKHDKHIFKIILGILLMIPILNALIASGSRGALIALLIGGFLLLLLVKKSLKFKIPAIILMLTLSAGLLNYIMLNNERFRERIMVVVEEGETGRNELWEASFKIIEDNLLLGVGKAGAIPIMKEYSGRAMDTHNVFLYVLITSGLIGFGFFITFIFRIGQHLYFRFKSDNEILYLVIYFTLLLNMSKAGGFLNQTFLWFYFALLIGVAHSMLNKKCISKLLLRNENTGYIA